MKIFTPLVFVLISCSLLQAQSIQFNLDSATFQDADAGSMDFGDIDNDGDLDLIITGSGGPIKSSLYKNDGLGNFTEIAVTPIINVYGGFARFEDINNDGDLDLLITGNTSSPITTANLYTNDGNGNFTLQSNTGLQPMHSGQFAFGDIDNDGDNDVLMTGSNAQGNAFTELYKNNNGAFTVVSSAVFEAVTSSAVAFIDYDSDNDLDLIISGNNNTFEKSASLYANDGTGIFTLVSNSVFDGFSTGDISVGDTDNDGDQDVLISGRNGANEVITKLYLNDGSGTFTLLSNTPFSPVWLGENALADFDNDGDLDVFILGSGPSGLINNDIVANIYENQGANNFVLSDSLIGAYLSSSAIGDVDGDLGLDLIIGGTSVGLPVRATRLYRNVTPLVNGVNDFTEDIDVQLFPNPVAETLHVTLTEASSSIIIYSLLGTEVASYNSNNLDVNINMTHLKPGCYVVSIETQTGTLTKKVIKE